MPAVLPIPIRRSMDRRITIRLDRRVVSDLQAIAAEHDAPVAEVARALLIQRLEALTAT